MTAMPCECRYKKMKAKCEAQGDCQMVQCPSARRASHDVTLREPCIPGLCQLLSAVTCATDADPQSRGVAELLLPRSAQGGFTRILHSGKADDLMNEIPTFVAEPLPPAKHDHKGYVVLNRPYAINQVQK